MRTAPWWAYLLFLQNLFPLALPPALGPTWSLAIEEQYYFVWAPLVRWLRTPCMLAVPLVAALIVSPIFRRAHLNWITPTHTLIHLDGIALGSLLAIGLYTLRLSRRTWLWIGLLSLIGGSPLPEPSPAAQRCSIQPSPCLRRRGARLHRVNRSAGRRCTRSSVAARWPSTAASATAST